PDHDPPAARKEVARGNAAPLRQEGCARERAADRWAHHRRAARAGPRRLKTDRETRRKTGRAAGRTAGDRREAACPRGPDRKVRVAPGGPTFERSGRVGGDTPDRRQGW